MALTDNREIIDIDIPGTTRQRFRINGDPEAIIELDLSDLNMIRRLEDGVNKLEAEMSTIANLPDDDNLTDKLTEADKRMREYIDYIFDYPVSAVCVKYGTMYDPVDGMFKWERIIDGLTKLYTDNINEEYQKMKARVHKHTDKYISKPSKTNKRK